MGLRDRLADTGKRFYCICFTCRSGSSLLASDLTQAGLGEPTEYFQFVDPKPGQTVDHIVDLAKRAQGDFFGFKIAWNQASILTERLRREGEASVTSDLRTVFPNLRYIHIVRADKVAQAVSYWRAIVTRQWHQNVASEEFLRRPDYDYAAIRETLLAVVTEDWLWESHFAGIGVPVHRIVYEDFLADRTSAVGAVEDFLGASRAPVPTLVEHTKIMRDEWSEEIISRVWTDLDATAVSDAWPFD